MKPKTISIILSTLFLLLFVVGCDDKKEEPHLTSINGTWKCIGFGDAKGNLTKEIQPKDCKECYVLTFQEDNTFRGVSSTNQVQGEYVTDTSSYKLDFLKFGGTEINELFDGPLYVESIVKVTNYKFLRKGELVLLYNNKSESLIFKSIEL